LDVTQAMRWLRQALLGAGHVIEPSGANLLDEAETAQMPSITQRAGTTPMPHEAAPLTIRRTLEERAEGPVRLGDLAREVKLLWCYCDVHAGGCGRERDVDPASLGLPPGTPVPGLGRRHMRCSRCGSKAIETRPELYPGGVLAWRARGGK
jgi:hypothetical protein